MALEFRLGTREDIPFLADIESSGDRMFDEAGHPEFLGGETVTDEQAALGVSQDLLLAVALDGELIGFALLDRSGDELELHQISVYRRLSGQGVGSKLLQFVMDHARTLGETSMILNTQADVPWNMVWYERFGFKPIPPDDWTEAMHATVAQQLEQNLDWDTRVHMRANL